ncbi:MAG: DUF1318 domain-containing protein, partial [FCB group bacterium]|nr:DUF1318 domain-containing protein [FCB group bacterium]
MRTKTLALLAAVSIVAAGCVIRTHHTIEAHVTIDIRQVDEQAENIVDYVTGEKDTLPVAAEAKPEEKKTSLLRRIWNDLSPIQVAYAAELKESSPKIKELADQMRARFPEVQALKAKGFVGETNRGYLDLVDGADLKGDDKNAAQRLIAAENADRKALYREVVELNKDQNVTLSVVERVFADKWLKQAKPGEKAQLPPAGEAFDAFKKSDLGKKLGDAAKPG